MIVAIAYHSLTLYAILVKAAPSDEVGHGAVALHLFAVDLVWVVWVFLYIPIYTV